MFLEYRTYTWVNKIIKEKRNSNRVPIEEIIQIEIKKNKL
jgi:hypothetical protein